MYNHTLDDYKCPICIAVKGIENEDTWIKQADIFYRDEWVVGFISTKFIPGNEGHPLIVPSPHFENIYDLHDQYAHHIIDMTRRVAIALKIVRQCDGIKIIQNNEPAAGQHAFHCHMHVIPRFRGDTFDQQKTRFRISAPAERVGYAKQLREYFSEDAPSQD